MSETSPLLKTKMRSGDCITVEEPLSKPRMSRTYLAAFSALLFCVDLGMVASYSAPATVDMKRAGSRFMDITQDEVTWIASLPTISAAVGTLVSGFACHILGRKAVMMYSAVPFVLGWSMVAYAPSMAWIYAGRLLCGICFGMCFVAVPAYVVEISPVHIRGLLSTGFKFTFCTGIFVMITLGYGLRWSWLAISGACLVAIAMLFMSFMPESPAWLARQSRKKEATAALKFLLGENIDTEKELRSLIDTNSDIQPQVSFRDIGNPVLYKPAIIGILLCFFQQFSGSLTLTSYNVEIFQNTGTPLDPNLSAVIFAGTQVVMTLVGGLLMDRAGRRLLFIVSGIAIAVTLGGLGAFCFFKYKGYDLSHLDWIPLACLIANVASYSIGFGPVPVVMTSELVPVHFRSVVITISGLFASAFTFTVTKSYGFLVTNVGYHGLFWTYCGFSLLGALYGWACLPETKGRTIKDISTSFERAPKLNSS